MKGSSLDYLYGKTITHIDGGVGSSELIFHLSNGERFIMYHEQDCCENVYIDDVNGDWLDLVGNPILIAEERVSEQEYADDIECSTWTFYTFRGVGGSVDVKWIGESNGYYSESVNYEFSAKP